MRSELSPTEFHIAESYCRGLIDKEVAEVVDKPVWTVRTHKKLLPKTPNIINARACSLDGM